VLVNEAAAGATPWTPERLAQLGEMIKTATGHQAERGDQFNITSFSFVPSDAATQMEGMAWWQMPEMKEYLRYLIGAIIGLALVIFGVRPLVNHLVSRKNKEQQNATGFHAMTGAQNPTAMQNADVSTGPAVLDAKQTLLYPITRRQGHNTAFIYLKWALNLHSKSTTCNYWPTVNLTG